VYNKLAKMTCEGLQLDFNREHIASFVKNQSEQGRKNEPTLHFQFHNVLHN